VVILLIIYHKHVVVVQPSQHILNQSRSPEIGRVAASGIKVPWGHGLAYSLLSVWLLQASSGHTSTDGFVFLNQKFLSIVIAIITVMIFIKMAVAAYHHAGTMSVPAWCYGKRTRTRVVGRLGLSSKGWCQL